MKIHSSITLESLELILSSDNDIGFCIACGHEHDQCEPDTRKRQCDNCGKRQVYGAQEIAFHLAHLGF